MALVSFLKVLILTGMPGSGKSTAVELAKMRGKPVFRMGDMVWTEVRARGLELENEVVGKVANEMRDKHGPGIWAERTVEQVRKGGDAPLIIIDGCRSRAELDVFRKEFGADLYIVAIMAPQRTRFERLKARARKDDIRTLEELRARDRREIRWGLDEVMKAADVKIRNDGTVEELRLAMDGLLVRLAGEGPSKF